MTRRTFAQIMNETFLTGDVAAALVAQHSAGWCERLVD